MLNDKKSHCVGTMHSCTKPRFKMDYNYQFEDLCSEHFSSDKYANLVVDGFIYNFGKSGGLLIDTHSYEDKKVQAEQQRFVESLSVDGMILRFPDGVSPADSPTAVAYHSVSKNAWDFSNQNLTEEQVIKFIREKTGNPVTSSEPFRGPYRFSPMKYELRSRYSRISQFQQWIRTPPQLCSSGDCQSIVFYDIDVAVGNLASGKWVLQEFKLDTGKGRDGMTEWERFLSNTNKSWFVFDQTMRRTDPWIGSNITRLLVILKSNERVDVRLIRKGIFSNKDDLFDGEVYQHFNSFAEYANYVKQLLN